METSRLTATDWANLTPAQKDYTTRGDNNCYRCAGHGLYVGAYPIYRRCENCASHGVYLCKHSGMPNKPGWQCGDCNNKVNLEIIVSNIFICKCAFTEADKEKYKGKLSIESSK